MSQTMTISPPIAERRPHRLAAHGVERDDPYHWLRDENWREVMRDPSVLRRDIRDYLEAENAYTEAMLADVADLRGKLFEELKGRIKADDSSPPLPDGPFAYYVRFEEAGEHPLYCRQPREGGPEEILLDGDALSKEHAFYRLGAVRQSFDHRLLAWAEDVKGSELYRVRVRDIDSGRVVDEGPEGTHGNIVWAKDNAHYFYTALNEDLRPDRVYCHRIGDDPSKDRLVYHETDNGYYLGVDEGDSRELVYIVSHASETTEVRILPADRPDADPVVIAPRREGHEYDVTDQGDRLIIRTNRDGAVDFKLMETPLAAPGEENWRELVPAREGVLLRGVTAFSGWLARLETVDALPRIVITDTATNESHEIAFDEEAYSLGIGGGQEYESGRLRFSYSSPTTPERVFDYDMVVRERELLKEQEIPSGHNPADYVVRRIQAKAHDGEEIPVTVLHRADARLDGNEPLMLYGYGSYGISIPASFSPHRFSLVDRGFVYAIAHIRGGMEKGYRWYLDGKLEKKTNTFRDFISAAEALIGRGWARAGEIAIHGGSAGGMLVGAVANMRPDLWKAVVAEVPFVDCLTTILDDSLPLTPPEWTEWGNPITTKAVHDLMLSYSPYDNVEAKAYPAMLINGGLTDPRVTYWEPSKWAAKLRASKTDDNLLLLKINMESGHGGSAGRFDKLKEVALNYVFLLKVFGRT
ncbi:S9 family peptidase [Minwuia thermotolerans]|uniref:S9 family peptidase n=1 Tax=Minwuia thermotolerans TaxID=2056226 RepID=A0A2M9FVV7_9PROT|nr:S9 family peptidase [Minwuia thermotolerans]